MYQSMYLRCTLLRLWAGDLCLAKDHVVCHNVAPESPTSGQNKTIKFSLTTAFSISNNKHNLSFLYCGLSQDESKLQLKVAEGDGEGVEWVLYYISSPRIQFYSYRASLMFVKFKISHKHTELKLVEIS